MQAEPPHTISRRASLPILLLAVLGAAAPARAARAAQTSELPGARADGSILLPSGWSLRPHGRQIALELDFPVRAALHPGGRYLAVQHAGYRAHAVALFDTREEVVVATLPIPKSWSGMCWSAQGDRLYVSGGVEDCVHVFSLRESADGAPVVSSLGQFPVGDGARLDLVAGLCLDAGGRLFVCLQRTDRLVRLANLGRPDLEVELPPGAMPFECVASVDGTRIFVSLWGLAQVWALDAESGEVLARIPSGLHPSSLLAAPDGRRLFVSNANENTVTVVDLEQHAVIETLSSALYPLAPPGSTPNALALAPDGERLLVANADNNDLALLDVSESGASRPLGFVPVGAYPTAVCVLAGGRVVVANGKGSIGSLPNPKGPQPERGHVADETQYSGALFLGSLSTFDWPDEEALERLTVDAYRGSPLEASAGVRGLAQRPADSPIPARVGDASPIRHCVYVIKENRTYDQVLGDMPEGDGAAELCLFPEPVTPNHHALARAWVLLDNFYVESEVSADGHEWTMGAYATDFVERTWPVTYGGKGSAKQEGGATASLGYPAEGYFDIAEPENGYLFDLAAAAGLSYRSYGEFVSGGKAKIAALEGHFDEHYSGYDLDVTDVSRAQRFLTELAAFEESGDFPALVVVRLPNDHTSGTRAGRRTPRAYVADNDLALGMLLEGLSRSSFWSTTTVFVVEDDAQNGPDHVDAHRTVALLAGPWVARGARVRTMYSTASMLRTMELILGLPPMSQFDAAARPMYDCFRAVPDASPYRCRPASWSLTETNDKTAWGAARSEQLDLSREDAADDLVLGEIVWKSIRGADSEPPAPVRAAFVRAWAEQQEED